MKTYWPIAQNATISIHYNGFILALVWLIDAIIGYSILTSTTAAQWGLGWDWNIVLKPGSLALLTGQSPYSVHNYASPPLVAVMLIPLAIIPAPFDLLLLTAAAVCGYWYSAKKLGASRLVILSLLFSPFLVLSLAAGNIDWMIPLGAVLPPQIGLFLVMSKPQIGLGVAAFWLVQAWMTGRIRKVMQVFLPFVLISGLLLALFPDFIFSLFAYAQPRAGNAALWPYLVPVGVWLIARAVKNRRIDLSISSGIFLSPYVGLNSLIIPVFGLLSLPSSLIIVNLSWVAWVLIG